MRRFLTVLLMAALVCGLTAAAAKKSTAKKAKKKAAPAAPRISAAQRADAQDEIARLLAADDRKIENVRTLAPFFEALQGQQPVHILQFGDSHTASDDWVNSVRTLLQAKYGSGGPGFVQAGSPYKGYRRFDARGRNSLAWRTEGTMALRGDPYQGLSGVSISTEQAGQTVSLIAEGETVNVFYLRQPGGGVLELTADGSPLGSFNTDGDTGPGISDFTLPPGPHELVLRTLDRAPVRLFGWTLDHPQPGVTVETLGINGAQANVILGWDETLWAAQVAARHPSLVMLAYGTNEANSHLWTLERYRADLAAVIARVRAAAPQAPILMIGPPDCGMGHALLHLAEVSAAQREIARERNVAFWDWRRHMGGPGSIRRWVAAGYAQADHIHLTAEGYRILGQTIVTTLLENRQDEQARENR